MFYYTFVSGYAGGFRFTYAPWNFVHTFASCEGQSLFEDMASRLTLGFLKIGER
jgi:hypothetical protein